MDALGPSMADHVISAKAGIESMSFIDDLVREYLLFRGFKNTLKAFEEDVGSDQDHGFKAERIVEELLDMAKQLKIEALLDYWKYLTFRFFSHLSPKYQRTTRMFEKRLIRLFLVSSVLAGKRLEIRAFMDKHGRSLGQQGGDWIPWLGLEYVDDPKTRPEFEAYFADDWYASLKTALIDFIQTVFPAMALPRILMYDKDRREREALETKLKHCEERLNSETRIRTMELSGTPPGLVENHIERVLSAESVGKRPLVSGQANDSGDSSYMPSSDQGVSVLKTNEPSSMLKVSQEDIFLEHNSGISLAKFSASGELIASYDDESILKVWSPDLASAAPKLKNELDFAVNAMAWDKKHAHLLYLYDEDGYIHTMNTSSNLMSRQLVFEKRHPWVQNMLCSPVSSSILTISSTKPEGTTDISLRIWDASANKTASSKRLLTSPESHGVCAAFNHNGNLLALAYSTGNVRLLDTRSFETVASIATKQSSVCAAEFRFDEDSLMVVSEVGKLTQWSLRKDSHMVAETQLSLGSGLSGNAVPADSRLDCDRVVFTPDREHVLVAPNNQCMVFNVDSAALTDTMRHHKDLVTCIDFAVDRSLSASDDGTIRVAKFRNV